MTDLLIFLYISIKLPPGSFVLSKQKATSLIHKLIALNDHSLTCLQSFSPSSSRTLRNSLPGLWWRGILLPDPHTGLSPSLSADIFPSSVHSQPTDLMASPAVSARSMSPVHSSALCLTAACWNFLCKAYSHVYLMIGPLLFCHNPWKK